MLTTKQTGQAYQSADEADLAGSSWEKPSGPDKEKDNSAPSDVLHMHQIHMLDKRNIPKNQKSTSPVHAAGTG